MSTLEKEIVTRGWYYTQDPADSTPQSSPTRKYHGAMGQWIIQAPNSCPKGLLLRLAYQLGDIFCKKTQGTKQSTFVEITTDDSMPKYTDQGLVMGQFWLQQFTRLELQEALKSISPPSSNSPLAIQSNSLVKSHPIKVLFFEAMMNSDVEHNDSEISQGVLHMASAISNRENVQCIFSKVKMPIEGKSRLGLSLEHVKSTLSQHNPDLICITLLEGYWEGVVELIACIREQGCTGKIAIGGVMPTLTPEHVALHLKDVAFICRGAGEYFLPHLVDIVAQQQEPMRQWQRISQLQGLIYWESNAEHQILISANADQVVKVDNLDKSPLDLQFVQAEHLQHGIEISTSRGCIHRCTFCNIIGREDYQARSSEGIIELLEKYDQRFHEIFNDPKDIPPQAYRVHISDDDFVCDKARASQFLKALLDTPFRLSSIQVSVADLCLKEKGRLLPKMDPEIFDAIQPECFADSSKDIAKLEWIADHQNRRWSSFLQIGVETFADAELTRLGKGYKVEHIRAVVDALAQRKIHMDAYFIQSNSETTAQDLVEGLMELVSLKLRYPLYFHVRFPPVPYLVSYFPGATYRKHIRRGSTHLLNIRQWAKEDGYYEYDYPFVNHDIPADPWVALAVQKGFFTGAKYYSDSLIQLKEIWQERVHSHENEAMHQETQDIRPLLRQLDDLPRRLVFQELQRTRQLARQKIISTQQEAQSIEMAEGILGEKAQWLPQLQRYLSMEVPRLVIIPTWQCELRCRYCFIPKQDGRVITLKTAKDAVDFLLSSDRPKVILQFFGGEALLEWPTLKECIAYAHQQASRLRKEVEFILSSNGIGITEDILIWLSQYTVKLELSLDGDPETQNKYRAAFKDIHNSYHDGISHKTPLIQQYIPHHEVIMVVHPDVAYKMASNFQHIANLGYKRIQINYGLGFVWSKEQMTHFSEQLMIIAKWLRGQWQMGDTVMLINLESDPMVMRLNAEITVDWDGSIHNGNAFLSKKSQPEKLRLGHLDDNHNFDRDWLDMLDNAHLLDCSYPPHVTENNLKVGKIFASFIRWMRKEGIPTFPKF